MIYTMALAHMTSEIRDSGRSVASMRFLVEGAPIHTMEDFQVGLVSSP